MMKILAILIGGVAFLVLVVVLVGLALPKKHVSSRSASYRAKPEQLYSLIAGSQSWRPEVARCEIVTDGSGHTLQRETTRNGETITYELLDASPPLSIKRRIADQGLPYAGTWTFSLEPKGDVTMVRIREDGEVYNPVFRFVSRFIIGHTRTIDAYLRALGKATGQEVSIHD